MGTAFVLNYTGRGEKRKEEDKMAEERIWKKGGETEEVNNGKQGQGELY